jgi:hypothetical protein
MNDRERFRRLMRGERVDRPPLLEEGVRDDQLPRGIGGPSARPRGLSSAVSGPCGASRLKSTQVPKSRQRPQPVVIPPSTDSGVKGIVKTREPQAS